MQLTFRAANPAKTQTPVGQQLVRGQYENCNAAQSTKHHSQQQDTEAAARTPSCGMQITQEEALEVLLIVLAFNQEDAWIARQEAGLFDYPERSLIPDVRFDLSTYGDANATKDFRFDVNGVKLLANLLALPATVITDEGDRCGHEEALAIMLHRLSYPRRLHDMMNKFGRSTSALSRIFLWMST
ncbi:hypothetical protein PR003_g10711 [Phytophthora rubi]|uniref:Uncharacterized protein n=1 Tax=Phytophthora rubi TaxID=129364 RepID=A0A6A4FIZ8_9STRA|nr:hypothetical protein PR003_g10711 [Phytophthora rubi]